MEKIGFKPGVKSDGVIDGGSGDDDELTCVEWRECKEEGSGFGQGNEFGSLFQRLDDAHHLDDYMTVG